MSLLGNWGENQAKTFFRKKNYTILEENLRAPGGEIDLLISSKTHGLIAVEVKTRRSKAYGNPLESITKKKIIGIFRVIEWYFKKQEKPIPDFQIDIITIQKSSSTDQFEIHHYPNIDTSHLF